MGKKLLILVILLLVNVPAFTQSVDTAWVRRYNGPDNLGDYASAIALDGSGNIYVTGGSSPGGGSNSDYATIKYYPNGDTAWVRRYNGPGDSLDYPHDIAVDDLGNVHVTGYSYDSVTYEDYATIKYYPNGDTAWLRRYHNHANDRASAITIDISGNVYVTGSSSGDGTYGDCATIKYYPNGDTAWVRRYNGPDNIYDNAFAIAIYDSGNVYVTGQENYPSETSSDYATIKYHPNGDTAWVRRYNGPADSFDEAAAIAVDRFGNTYVTGSSSGNGTFGDYATIKYYTNGDTAWVRRYNGPGDSLDYAHDIAVDDLGNVYVTGGSDGSWTGKDYLTIKYYPNGDTDWVRRYDGPGSGPDDALALAIDGSRNVYVTGYSYGSGTQSDYATIKYNSNGDTVWVMRYNGLGDAGDVANALTVDNSGNVYVTGGSPGSGSNSDYTTIKYIQFLRGDANDDGDISIGDVIFLINYLFRGGTAPSPIQSGDANCDGKVSIGDIIYLINYLFKGGPPPCN